MISMRKSEDTGADENVESHGTRNFWNRDHESGTDTTRAGQKRPSPRRLVAKKREEVRDDLREAGDRARDRPGGYAEAPKFRSIFMETVMMIKLTRFQNQSQIVQSSGTSWMVKNKKL